MINFYSLSCYSLVDSFLEYIPVNIFTILQYFDLDSFLSNFILYIFFFKLI